MFRSMYVYKYTYIVYIYVYMSCLYSSIDLCIHLLVYCISVYIHTSDSPMHFYGCMYIDMCICKDV